MNQTSRIVSRAASILFIAAIPLFLVTSNVRVLVGEVRFYERGLRENNAAAVTGISLEQLDHAAAAIVAYFEDDASELRPLVIQDGREVSLFNARETEHMRDVKTLIRLVFRINELSLVVILTYITAVYLWSNERPLRALARQALIGVAAGVVALGAVGVFVLAGFDAAWRTFHEIAFSNDLWLLDPARDHLIQMFPEPFWQEATYLLGLATLAEAFVIVVTSGAYLVFSRKQATPRP